MTNELTEIIKNRKTRAKEYNEYVIDRLRTKLIRFNTAPAEPDRESVQECKTCYYLLPDFDLAGDSGVTYNCDICGKELVIFANMKRYYCKECAAEHGLCTRCGGVMD